MVEYIWPASFGSVGPLLVLGFSAGLQAVLLRVASKASTERVVVASVVSKMLSTIVVGFCLQVGYALSIAGYTSAMRSSRRPHLCA